VVPDRNLSSSITHVVLAFMNSNIFNDEPGTRADWPIFMSVDETRAKFKPLTKVMIAIGGWGDTAGFELGMRTEQSRYTFAKNVAAMLVHTGADGVDIDLEYPGGNGEDYKKVPNSEKSWEIEAYPLLLAAIREAVGPEKLISAATPGLKRDMLAFTPATVPAIMQSVDYLNIMTYDLMNRRDNVTKHHTGRALSLESIDAYVAAGALAKDLNLGFAFYTKFFRLDRAAWQGDQMHKCLRKPVGCPTGLMEDPATGADLGKTGGFSWHDPVPLEVKESFDRALTQGTYDNKGGGYYYFDEKENLWWTFDNPAAISKKFPEVVAERKLGGVFAWGLGEDAPEFKHLEALNVGLRELQDDRDEL
jgi:GH18 family chitinase